jgi:histidine ammonia-lyase
MGSIAARELRSIQNLADHVLVISMLAAAQATDATGRADALPPPLRRLYDGIREICAATDNDQRHDLSINRCLARYQGGTLIAD